MPPTESAPRCAAASIPKAPPLMMVYPDSASAAANSVATRKPYGVAFREPTIAIDLEVNPDKSDSLDSLDSINN